jgi:hypothetical protein
MQRFRFEEAPSPGPPSAAPATSCRPAAACAAAPARVHAVGHGALLGCRVPPPSSPLLLPRPELPGLPPPRCGDSRRCQYRYRVHRRCARRRPFRCCCCHRGCRCLVRSRSVAAVTGAAVACGRCRYTPPPVQRRHFRRCCRRHCRCPGPEQPVSPSPFQGFPALL